MAKVDKLRAEGVGVARGHLALDRLAAKRKLGMFSLPDPHFWVLQIVRAAVVSGATRLAFEVSATSVVATFDAKLSSRLLSDIWNVALDERTSPERSAIHWIALGISAARSFEPKSIVVTADGGSYTIAGDEERFQPGEARPDTEVRVDEELRMGHLLEFFDTIRGRSGEERALMQYANLAPVRITVNKREVNLPGLLPIDSLPATWGAVNGSPQLDVFLLRDGVRVRHSYGPFAPVGGIVAHDNDAVQLDLSTMSVVAAPADLTPKMTDAYLALVRRRIRVQRTNTGEAVAILELAVSALMKNRSAATSNARLLVEELLDLPICPPAQSQHSKLYPLNSARRDGAIEVASARMPDVFEKEFEHVLVLQSAGLIERLTSVGYPCRDMTAKLTAARHRKTNFERWKRSAPRRPRGTAELRRAGAFTAWVEPIDPTLGAVEFCIDALCVRVDPVDLPVRIVFDGPFETNAAFDDIEPTSEVRTLAPQLVEDVRALWHTAAQNQQIAWSEPVILGTFERLMFGAMRVDDLTPSGDLPSTAQEWIDRLGSLADAPLIIAERRGNATLREILVADEPAVFGPVDTYLMPLSPNRIIVAPESPLANCLPLMRPGVGAARQVFDQEAGRRRFAGQELYRPPERPGAVERERSDEHQRVRLTLRPYDDHSRADVKLVLDGKLIGRHVWDAPHGKWDVIVWSDRFRPNNTYTDVVHDDALQDAITMYRALVSEALEEWYEEMTETGLIDHTQLGLFWSMQEGRDVDQRHWPIWRWDGAGWTPSVLTTQQLRDAARSNGDALPFTMAREIKVGPVEGNVVLRPDTALTQFDMAQETFRLVMLHTNELVPQVRPEPAPAPADDGAFRDVRDTLLAVREGHREFLGDAMLQRFGLRDDPEPWNAGRDGTTLGREHPLASLLGSDDPVHQAFLASTAATAINAYYRSFTDTDELALQQNLLRWVVRTDAGRNTHRQEDAER